MTIDVNQLFLDRLKLLIKEVLTDESKYLKGELTLETLHERIFSSQKTGDYKVYTQQEQLFFRKYFYQKPDSDVKRTDVPFTDSPEDQAFFFDIFSHLAAICTYKSQRLGLICPTLNDGQDAKAVFNEDQEKTLTFALMYPLIHAMEQREISKIEQSSTSEAKPQEDNQKNNPFNQLDRKTLAKNSRGEYATILTLDQVQLLDAQEKMYRTQGYSGAELVKKMQEYINSEFKNLDLTLTADGKVELFIGRINISRQKDDSNEFDIYQSQTLSFEEILIEFKIRQASKVHYACVIASEGHLGFSNEYYQIIGEQGIVETVDGAKVSLEQGGLGNNAMIFVEDLNGVSARITISVDKAVNEENAEFDFKIYFRPDEDLPDNPSFKLTPDQLDKLKKALMQLYAELEAVKKAQTAKPQPLPLPRGSDTKPIPEEQPTMPLLTDSPTTQTEDTLTVTIPRAPLTVGLGAQGGPMSSRKPRPKVRSLADFSRSGSKTHASVQPPKPNVQGNQAEQQASAPSNQVQPKVTADGAPAEEHNVTQQTNSKSRAGTIVALATGLPIVGSAGAVIINILGLS